MFRFPMLATLVIGTALLCGSTCRAADGLLGVELVERNGKVVILNVIRGSDAEQVGIQPGDVLFKVGTTQISSIQDALNAKSSANNNEDIPFIIETPGGLWAINARFEKGQPYGKYKAVRVRPRR